MATHKGLRPSLDRHEDRQERAPGGARLRAALAKPRPASEPEYLTRIPVRDRTTLVVVPTSQVATIVAEGERHTITTIDHHQHSLLYRLRDLEARLDPAVFIRLNRGALVNINAVSRIVAGPSGTNVVIFENGQELCMSRIQSQRLRRILRRLLR